MAFDTFISYSQKDKAIADAACATLERAGIRCWIAPRDVPPGSQWAASIVDAIDHCRLLVLIFSSQANISNQIHREVERAVSKGIPIIPLRIEDVLPTSSMEYFLGSIHWLDALTPPLEKHLERLRETVQSCLGVGQSGAGATARSGAAPQAAADPNPAPTTARLEVTQPAGSSRPDHVGQSHAAPRQRWALLAAFLVLIAAGGGAAIYYLKFGQGTLVDAAPVVPTVSPEARRFDGLWMASLVCESTPSGLPGWKYQFVGRVRDGNFHALRGSEGQPGSETFDGPVDPDGSAQILQIGLSGDTKTDAFHRPPGTEYRNTYVGRFVASRGRFTRLDRGSCNIDFVQGGSPEGSTAPR
jgi:hypothetical protein